MNGTALADTIRRPDLIRELIAATGKSKTRVVEKIRDLINAGEIAPIVDNEGRGISVHLYSVDHADKIRAALGQPARGKGGPSDEVEGESGGTPLQTARESPAPHAQPNTDGATVPVLGAVPGNPSPDPPAGISNVRELAESPGPSRQRTAPCRDVTDDETEQAGTEEETDEEGGKKGFPIVGILLGIAVLIGLGVGVSWYVKRRKAKSGGELPAGEQTSAAAVSPTQAENLAEYSRRLERELGRP